MESDLAEEKRFSSLFRPGLGAIVHGEDTIGHRLDIVDDHSENRVGPGWLRKYMGFPSVVGFMSVLSRDATELFEKDAFQSTSRAIVP